MSGPELTPKTRKPRRTNRQRTADTRRALLDATIECLSELGYSATTTTVVCERAGVSRGAQLHHFPTKASLVTSAVVHVFEKLNELFRRSLREFPQGAKKGEAAIDLLWKMVSGSTFHAWLELVVASRSDPELRASVRRIQARFGDAIAATYAELFPHRAGSSHRHTEPEFVFSVLEGLALSEIAEPDPLRVERVLGVLKAVSGVADQLTDLGSQSPEAEN